LFFRVELEEGKATWEGEKEPGASPGARLIFTGVIS
jgi:hypothetical protein